MVHSYILKGNTNRPSKFVETLNYMPNTFCIIRNGYAIFLSKFYMITTFIGMLALRPRSIFGSSEIYIISRRISLSEVYCLPVFIVGKKCIRHPYLFSKIARQCQDFVFFRAEGKSFILPILI